MNYQSRYETAVKEFEKSSSRWSKMKPSERFIFPEMKKSAHDFCEVCASYLRERLHEIAVVKYDRNVVHKNYYSPKSRFVRINIETKGKEELTFSINCPLNDWPSFAEISKKYISVVNDFTKGV